MSYNKKRHDGVLRIHQSIYGRIAAGDLGFALMVLVSILLIAVPWDEFSHTRFYQILVPIMGQISTNLSSIPNESKSFPEYAVAFVALLNLIGPFYLLFSVLAAQRHMDALDKKGIALVIQKKSGFILLLGVFAIFALVLIYSAYTFSGRSSINPELFTKEKWRFVMMFAAEWWACGFFIFGMVCLIILGQKNWSSN